VKREYNDLVATSLKRRVLRAGSWQVVKRTVKLIPVAGSVFALGLAGYEIKKKGLIAGVAHVGLDMIPLVGTTKGVIEIFAGDLIPDREVSPKAVRDQPEPRVDQPSRRRRKIDQG
jgi:hypothetical protein